MPTNKYNVDMRASLGAELNYYETKTYKPEFAVAEFVDNSVASYLKDKVFLQTYESNYKLRIDIDYDLTKKALQVTDNAGGMDQETFNDALVLGKKPKDRQGLNEFGFGLKSAASWFGKKWSVTSTTFNVESEFKAIVDIPDLMKTGNNFVPIEVKKVKKGSHYTIVKIWNLTKTITKKHFNNLKTRLSSIYRRFIEKGEISIYFNGEKLEYVQPECLKTVEDGIEKTWKHEFDDEIKFEGKIYPISGFIGLLKEGSYKKAGFTLIRRNRVIIGGDEENLFKPTEIFGSANSFTSFRLFGEISMDKWPVTQAKDNFDWDMNGLKDAFLDKLKDISKIYIKKASEYRVSLSKNPITPIKAQEIADETKKNIDNMGPRSRVKIVGQIPPISVKTEDGIEIPSIVYPLEIDETKYFVTVEFICDNEADAVVVEPKRTDKTQITISFNTAFPMFQSFKRNNSAFIKVLQKFFIALVIAEEQVLRVADDGETVKPVEIREKLNDILNKMSLEGDFDDED